jgi:hypothetical protein
MVVMSREPRLLPDMELNYSISEHRRQLQNQERSDCRCVAACQLKTQENVPAVAFAPGSVMKKTRKIAPPGSYSCMKVDLAQAAF